MDCQLSEVGEEVVCGRCGRRRRATPGIGTALRIQCRAMPLGTCQHLGDLKELRQCPTCQGNVKVKVFFCRHPEHAETTIEGCQMCPDHSALPGR